MFSCNEQVNETLKELHLLKHAIRDFGATRLAEELQHNFTLTYLALSWYLSQFLKHTPFLPRNAMLAMLSAVYAVVLCLSVRPSVCLSHSGIVTKRLNVGSRK